MDGRTLNRILNLGAEHALYREDGGWYHHLEIFPGVLFDKNGYVFFATQAEYLSHPRLSHAQDLHITHGLNSLKEYVLFSKEQKRQIIFEAKEVDEEAIRVLRQVNTIVRKIELVRKIKNTYSNTCQVCTKRLPIGKGKYYSEVHHIQPLGHPHNGPDKIENMICVCPNCHVQLDLGAIAVASLKLSKHKVHDEYVAYHNTNIFNK
jgi:5-methylcytosine-specific restriction protein A